MIDAPSSTPQKPSFTVNVAWVPLIAVTVPSNAKSRAWSSSMVKARQIAVPPPPPPLPVWGGGAAALPMVSAATATATTAAPEAAMVQRAKRV